MPKRSKTIFEPMPESLRAALVRRAGEQAVILQGSASAALLYKQPRISSNVVDTMAVREEALRRFAPHYPMELAELLIIDLVMESARGGPENFALVRDALNRRANELLAEHDWLFDPAIKHCLRDKYESGPTWSNLVLGGIDLDAELLLRRPSKHREAAIDLETRLLYRDSHTLVSGDSLVAKLLGLEKLLGLQMRPTAVGALFALGMPVAALHMVHLVQVAAMAGSCASTSEVKYRQALHCLDIMVAQSGGREENLIRSPLPAVELVAQVDAAWAQARMTHPIYSLVYNLATRAASSPSDVGAAGYPGEPLAALAERINALLSPDARLKLEDIAPQDMLKLVTMCPVASEHHATRLFYANAPGPFKAVDERRRNSPDDVLRWVAQDFVGRSERLTRHDLRVGNQGDRLRSLLGEARSDALQAMAHENELRLVIDREAASSDIPVATATAAPARRKARL